MYETTSIVHTIMVGTTTVVQTVVVIRPVPEPTWYLLLELLLKVLGILFPSFTIVLVGSYGIHRDLDNVSPEIQREISEVMDQLSGFVEVSKSLRDIVSKLRRS